MTFPSHTSGKPYRPFSNGSQHYAWTCANCDSCTKATFETEVDQPGNCEIFDAISAASFGDGTLDEEIARRMGYLKPDGSESESYAWRCTEWTQEPQPSMDERQARIAEEARRKQEAELPFKF